MWRLQTAIWEGSPARKCMESHYLLSYPCRKFAEISCVVTKEPSKRIMQPVRMLISPESTILHQPAVGHCGDKAIPLPGTDFVDKSSCPLCAITPNLSLALSNCSTIPLWEPKQMSQASASPSSSSIHYCRREEEKTAAWGCSASCPVVKGLLHTVSWCQVAPCLHCVLTEGWQVGRTNATKTAGFHSQARLPGPYSRIRSS